jgi:hypothetical protein
MIKEMKQRYRLNGKLMSLKELYATLPKNKDNEILGDCHRRNSLWVTC